MRNIPARQLRCANRSVCIAFVTFRWVGGALFIAKAINAAVPKIFLVIFIIFGEPREGVGAGAAVTGHELMTGLPGFDLGASGSLGLHPNWRPAAEPGGTPAQGVGTVEDSDRSGSFEHLRKGLIEDDIRPWLLQVFEVWRKGFVRLIRKVKCQAQFH